MRAAACHMCLLLISNVTPETYKSPTTWKGERYGLKIRYLAYMGVVPSALCEYTWHSIKRKGQRQGVKNVRVHNEYLPTYLTGGKI